MEKCKLKKGDRIYECRYREATLIELITDPELCVQGSGSHYWHWKAKVIETNSHDVVLGEIVEFGITEEAPQYGPQLFRKNVYEVGFDNAEPILPPFDTSMNAMAGETAEDVDYITGLTFCSDERGITCQGHPLLEKLSIHPIGEGMLWMGNSRGPLFFANSLTGKARQLLDEESHLVGFDDRDFDWEKLKTVEHTYDLNHRYVDYGGLGRYSDYRNGICCLCWMLYPDGRYFADEDGFGMDDNDEENIYCIIDDNLRVIIPWQPMTDEEMAMRMREARERTKKEEKISYGEEVMNDLEKKALEFIAKTKYIVQDKSQEIIDSLFDVLDSLSLPAGFSLGLKLAGEVGIGDESWFYTYQGKDPIDTFSCRAPNSSTLFKDIIVEPTVMGAWQAYLIFIAPTILPTFWHGGYIAREYFFDRAGFKGITSNWARGNVDVKLSQIPQPTVEMRGVAGAVITCPYWNDWVGLVLETVDVDFCRDGTISLRSHKKVLYEYDCGICY